MSEQPGAARRRSILPWVFGLGTLVALAVVVTVVGMLAQPGPVAASKSDAIEACRAGLDSSIIDVTTSDIVAEVAYTSMDWADARRAREARIDPYILPIDGLTAEEVAEIDAMYTVQRGNGRETVWVQWDMTGNQFWECTAVRADGEIVGAPSIMRTLLNN